MEAYLFDLGNVLADFEHRIFCRRLAAEGSPLEAETIYREVFQGGANDRFEDGRLGGEGFYEALRGPLRLRVGPVRFREIWCEIFWENKGMRALLEALRPHARLVLVSNTNPWHVAWVREHTRLLEPFHRQVLSYEVGVRKPDPAFFHTALEAAGTRPERCLYFDDSEENVRAAEALGIHSVLFRFTGEAPGNRV